MERKEDPCFEAWLEEERRIISFHEIPNSRHFCAGEREFWGIVIRLVMEGYRVQ